MSFFSVLIAIKTVKHLSGLVEGFFRDSDFLFNKYFAENLTLKKSSIIFFLSSASKYVPEELDKIEISFGVTFFLDRDCQNHICPSPPPALILLCSLIFSDPL